MNFLNKNRLPMLLSISLLMITACSSQQKSVALSETHLYNNHYGIVQDVDANAIIEEEEMNIQSQAMDDNDNETFSPEPGTFLAEDYVQPPEVITYKYQFDPKFYSKAEWRKFP